MTHVAVIGCGVVGAAIAYELSRVPGLKVTVKDRQQPAAGATGAALGVLMGFISQKIKGRNWQLRLASMQRYETLIPELESLTGRQIPFNRQGILMLCNASEDMAKWEKLVEIRRSRGFSLEIWDPARVKSRCPHLDCEKITAAVYSPQDRQVEPVSLTLAMVDAAQRNGASFDFGVTVEGYSQSITSENQRLCQKIQTKRAGEVNEAPLLQEVDWLVVAAGLGSVQSLQGMENGVAPARTLTQNSLASLGVLPRAEIKQQLEIRPVLGQALHLRRGEPLGDPDFQPVITGDDVHIVPVGGGDYWVGATVEFPIDGDVVVAAPDKLEAVRQKAIAHCPALADATVVRTWSGLRPRPEGQPAPVISPLAGYSNVLLATGHYRNGVLLAPATALAIRQMITAANG